MQRSTTVHSGAEVILQNNWGWLGVTCVGSGVSRTRDGILREPRLEVEAKRAF